MAHEAPITGGFGAEVASTIQVSISKCISLKYLVVLKRASGGLRFECKRFVKQCATEKEGRAAFE